MDYWGAQRVCWPPLKLLGGGAAPPLPTPMKTMNGLGAGCVQLWILSAEPPREHRYENRNNNNKNFTAAERIHSRGTGRLASVLARL